MQGAYRVLQQVTSYLRSVAEITRLNTRKAILGGGDIECFFTRALPLSGQ